MSSYGKLRIEVKLNNVIYECYLDKKKYNAKNDTPYFIGMANGVMASPADPQRTMLDLKSVPVCEECYRKNSDDQGLRLEDPSPIEKPDRKLVL